MTSIQIVTQVVLMGCGATLVMDVWLAFLKRLGVQTLNFSFIGRWVGHVAQGRFSHAAIGKAAPIRGELLLGWLTHYGVGVGFAALLVALCGTPWVTAPRLAPALALGVGTVLIPLLVMQPAMGLGFAASKTPTPVRNCIRSLANHAVFGLGLFLSAVVIEWVPR